MAQTTTIFGILFLLLGLAGYGATGGESITALIPAAFGLLFLLAGRLARREHLRRHVMHAAVVLGLLGFLGTVGALPALFAMIGGGEVERPAAVVSRSLMALLSLVFVGLGVKSFADARRNRS